MAGHLTWRDSQKPSDRKSLVPRGLRPASGRQQSIGNQERNLGSGEHQVGSPHPGRASHTLRSARVKTRHSPRVMEPTRLRRDNPFSGARRRGVDEAIAAQAREPGGGLINLPESFSFNIAMRSSPQRPVIGCRLSQRAWNLGGLAH
jgi:hypothetical protein